MNSSPVSQTTTKLERLAFFPQIFLSAFAIPVALSKRDLSGALLCQTFAFVAFNKVCTSQVRLILFYRRLYLISRQYFLWYLIFLPIYLPNSDFVARPAMGLLALAAWVLGQGYWLYEGYKLEFLGEQAFVPGLWYAGLIFFGVNCWILGHIIDDVSKMPKGKPIAMRKTK
jgi:GPI mannosyltransferase 1 subunit M